MNRKWPLVFALGLLANSISLSLPLALASRQSNVRQANSTVRNKSQERERDACQIKCLIIFDSKNDNKNQRRPQTHNGTRAHAPTHSQTKHHFCSPSDDRNTEITCDKLSFCCVCSSGQQTGFARAKESYGITECEQSERIN